MSTGHPENDKAQRRGQVLKQGEVGLMSAAHAAQGEDANEACVAISTSLAGAPHGEV